MVMFSKKTCFIFVILPMLILMSGCSFLSPVSGRPITTYTIASAQDAISKKSSVKVKAGTLLVTQVAAAPGYQTAAMIYVKVPFRIKAFGDNRWVAPPAQLLLPIIADKIRDKGIFHAVVLPPFTGVSQLHLNIQLIMLQQEFFTSVSQVNLSVRATLLKSATGQVVASRVFRALVPAPGNNPYSGVLATRKAAEKISTMVGVFVSDHSRSA